MSCRLLHALSALILACSAIVASKAQAQVGQLQSDQATVVQGPPAPVLAGPAPDAMLMSGDVRFQWQPGPNQTSPVRFEICVREPQQSCADPAAAIFKPSGVLLTEGVLQRKSADPRFPVSGEGTGVPTYFFRATMPQHLKGKRLLWSISACVPDTRTVRFANAPAEICSSSASRGMAWALSLPTLRAPASNSVLQTLTDEFSWDAEPQGIEYFLICFAARGTACPTVPGIQPLAQVMQIPSGPTVPRSFTPKRGTLELNTLMGETLEWTVASCNYRLGCTYQPAHRAFRVPIVEGSWDSLYVVTQEAKCKNCHQFLARNDTYRRHIDQGRFAPGDEKEPRTCDGCHNAETGYVDGWRPATFSNFDVPLTDSHVCQALRIDDDARHSLCLSCKTGAPHALGDDLVRWAVDRIPGLGFDGWKRRFEMWSAAKRPCCSSPKSYGCASEPPHGQFGLAGWNSSLSWLVNETRDPISIAFGTELRAAGSSLPTVAPGAYAFIKRPIPICNDAADFNDKAISVSTLARKVVSVAALFRVCQDVGNDRVYVVQAGGSWQDRKRCSGLADGLYGSVRIRVQSNGLPTCDSF
jgi:hypothetical protein